MKTIDDAAFEANFAAVKAVVFCDEVASEEVTLRQEGKHLRGCCPLPDHAGDSRSFYCYDNGAGVFDKWYCHRCSEGGDVIDLYTAMYGPYGNPVFAMQELAEHYGVQLAKPEEFASSNQLMVAKAKRQAQQSLAASMAMLSFQQHVVPVIREIEDPAERKRVMDACLEEAGFGKGGRCGA